MDLAQATQDVGLFTTLVWTSALEFFPRFVAAVAIVVIGWLVARIIGRQVGKLVLNMRRVDSTLAPVLSAIVRYGILIFVLVAALSQIGVQTASLLAVLGAAGLAIGLALQGTLANIAAGFMLLWLRPFRTGDYIDAEGIAGTVIEVGLFATKINTYDGVFRFVPNQQLWNKAIFNYTRNRTRMTDIAIGIDYGADIEKARSVLIDLAKSDSRVKAEPAPDVFVDDLADSAVILRYRVWISTADFWPTHRYLIEEGKRRLDAAGIGIPFPQRVVHMIKDGDAPGDDAATKAAA